MQGFCKPVKPVVKFHHYFDSGGKVDLESVPAKLNLWSLILRLNPSFSAWITKIDTSAAERGFFTITDLL